MKCYLFLFTRKGRCLPCGFPSVLCYVCMVLLDDNFHISRFPLQRGKFHVGKLPNAVANCGIIFPVLPSLKLYYIMHLFCFRSWTRLVTPHCECESSARYNPLSTLRSRIVLKFAYTGIFRPCYVFLKTFFFFIGVKNLKGQRIELEK